MTTPLGRQRQTFWTPTRIFIGLFGTVALLLGGMRGTKILFDWRQSRQYSISITDFYPAHQIACAVSAGDRSADPGYDMMRVGLSENRETSQHPEVELLIDGQEWVEIREAVERELTPAGFTRGKGLYGEFDSIVWHSKQQSECLVVTLTGARDQGEFVQIYGDKDAKKTSSNGTLRIYGHVLTFPCRRSEFVAWFGTPQTQQRKVDHRDK